MSADRQSAGLYLVHAAYDVHATFVVKDDRGIVVAGNEDGLDRPFPRPGNLLGFRIQLCDALFAYNEHLFACRLDGHQRTDAIDLANDVLVILTDDQMACTANAIDDFLATYNVDIAEVVVAIGNDGVRL